MSNILICFLSIDDNRGSTIDQEGTTIGVDGEEQPVNPNLPIRQYLDKHIMPGLLEALEKLTEDKPEDPIQFIGEYLLKQESRT